MEQEVYYQCAEDALKRGIYIAHLIVLLLGTYNQLRTTIGQWIGINDSVTAALHAQITWIKSMIQRLILFMTWTKAYGELALLYAEDLSIFIRWRHRFDMHRWRIPSILTTSDRHSYGGEECFIITLFHMIKGTPFTEMARHTFGGDPRCLSRMYQVMIDHLYLTFYNKISGTSMDQWIPLHLNSCRRLIYDALADGAI